MYMAKQSDSGYVAYIPERDQANPRRLALMGELRRAIDDNQLFPHYQPKIDLKTGRIIGVETLVRWKHPHFGVIPPDQFITLAEYTGLIKPLTLWVLNAALLQSEAWRRDGMKISVAVNLSARSLQDSQLPERVAQVLQTCGAEASQLELEITESVIMADPLRAMEILTRLSGMGIRLSIDDFGTGYSSLGYLKKLPVDEVKIDKSFVKEMASNEDDIVIVRSTIDLAHNLGMTVVAEGVENQETLTLLAALGCDAAQGYYISRPTAAVDLVRWLNETAPSKGWKV
jgi:EAL domain-containing protein (putative c-di-GMP-specific phosphodiesterase class I)